MHKHLCTGKALVATVLTYATLPSSYIRLSKFLLGEVLFTGQFVAEGYPTTL